MEFEDFVLWAVVLASGATIGLTLVWLARFIQALLRGEVKRLTLKRRRKAPPLRTPRTIRTSAAQNPASMRSRSGSSAGPTGNAATAQRQCADRSETFDDRLKTGDLAGADRLASQIVAAEPRFRAYATIARAALEAGDRQMLVYAEAAEEAMARLPEEQDEWLDAASRGALLRYDAASTLADLYCDAGRPDLAARALGRSSSYRLTLHGMRKLLADHPGTEGLKGEIAAVLRRLRAVLDRGGDPFADAPEGQGDVDELVLDLSTTWAALGDLDAARAELDRLPETRREQAEAALQDAARRGDVPGEESRNEGTRRTSDPEPPQHRLVPVEEIAAAAHAGDLDRAEALANMHQDTRMRERYRRDVARAHADRGDMAAARRVAGTIEDAGTRIAALREIDRIEAGGPRVPPVGDLVAVVVDNHQPGNPEKQQYVRGFADDHHLRTWAERRIRASLERYRQPGLSTAEIAAAWRHGGDGICVNYRTILADRIDDWAAHPASAEEVDFEALTPRLF